MQGGENSPRKGGEKFSRKGGEKSPMKIAENAFDETLKKIFL